MREAVVDGSAVVDALAYDDARGEWARRELGIRGLFAPQIMPAEVTQVVRRLESSGRLPRSEAARVLSDLVDLPAWYVDFASVADRVWELRATVSAYDAWYVAVAEALDLPLITSDLRLASAPGPTCAFVTPQSRT